MRAAGMMKGADLFGYLPIEDVDKLSNFSRVEELGAGEWVCQRGAPADQLFLLLKGAVQLRLPARAGESAVALTMIEPGCFVGLSALLGDEKYTASALTTVPSSLLAIQAKPLRALIKSNHKLGYEILNNVARGYAERYGQLLTRMQAVVNQLPLLCMAVRGPRAGGC